MKGKLKDLRRFRRMLKENSPACPACRAPFDQGRRRRLLDACGHARCYACLVASDRCPLCPAAGPGTSVATPRRPASGGKGRPSSFFLPRQLQVQTRPNSISVESTHHLAELTQQDYLQYRSASCHIRAKVPAPRWPPQSSRGQGQQRGAPAETTASTGSLASMSSASRPSLQSLERSASSLMSLGNRTDEGAYAQGESGLLLGELISEKSTATTLRLKPLYFEVPQPEPDHPFLGRHWLLKEIEKMFSARDEPYRGMAITGAAGTGKTSLILQLVDYSSFGRKWEETLSQTQDIYWKIRDLTHGVDSDQMSVSSRGSNQKSNNLGPTDSVLYQAAAKVVGYHFCQKDYNVTCMVPDFVHSLAAQLCQAPQLQEYRNLLLKDTKYQHLLCLDACLADPDQAFLQGILEPLHLLRRAVPLEALLVVDSLHEAGQWSEQGSLATFLAKHLPRFPPWLKLIISVRTDHQDLVSMMKLKQISLDMCNNSFVQEDMLNYIHFRISNSNSMQNNINLGRKVEEKSNILRFTEHLAAASGGGFLFAKLALDLLHRGHLVLKSSSFSVLPTQLKEVFLLKFNLTFPSLCAFEKVRPILELCLSSLYPLTLLEVYHSLNARYRVPKLSWFEFLQQVETLRASHILVHRLDGSLMISYPSLREWLTRAKDDSCKFYCDQRRGHVSLALRMARFEAPLSPEQSLEFTEHLLGANLFGSSATDANADFLKYMPALWLQHCMLDATASLAHERNIFAPSIDVSRLLLQAGADPDTKVGLRKEMPIMNLAAKKGHTQFLLLLMEFGADCNSQNLEDGSSPLMAASREGHEPLLQILLAAGAKVHLKDAEGRTCLCYAAEKGCLDIVKILIKCQWPDHITLNSSICAAFVTAAGNGHIEVCDYLMQETAVQANCRDPVSGHTGLTLASRRGQEPLCRWLLGAGASPAAAGGGRTPLMWAAAENRVQVLKLLLQQGAPLQAQDGDGLSALAWAASTNCVQAAQCLLDHKADIECSDRKGRSPLSFAVMHKDGEMVNLLLKYGANMEHKDHCGNTPLETAICEKNVIAVSKLLHQGVKLGPKIWCSAQKQPNMLLVLMHKLLSDGVVLYKKEKLQESKQRFQYALNKFPSQELQGEKTIKFKQLQFYLHLGLSRSHRKLKEYDLATESADRALDLRPDSYEALYVKAKAKHEAGQYQGALHDVTRAIHVAHADTKVLQTLQNLRADILTSSKVVCPLDGLDADACRSVPQSRKLSEVSSHEMQPIRPFQPCRALCERQLNNAAETLHPIPSISHAE